MLFSKAIATKAVLSFVFATIALTLFQNCSPTKFTMLGSNTLSSTAWCDSYPNTVECLTSQAPICRFNGLQYNEGQAVTAYISSVGNCENEQRICRNGAFTGTYQFASCDSVGPSACLFNGQTIRHGQIVTAFQNSSAPFGGACISENRICSNEILSGSFNFATCTVGAAAACLFNGQTIPHGQSVASFANASVPFGSTCQPQQRNCFNGALSAGGNFSACTVGEGASCLFNGQTIPHGGSVTSYLNLSEPYGQTCRTQSRVCHNGSLSGSYNFASCSTEGASSCSFNGQVVASGQTVRAFQNLAVPFPGQCLFEDRICTNGNLSGSFNFASCVAQPASNCSFNGNAVAHGQSITAFATSTVPFGQTCSSEQRQCANGVLSGSYTNTTCTAQGAASCQLGGSTIAHGAAIRAFQASEVPSGQTCASQDRVCSNGTLSGTYTHLSCSVGAPAACSFAGQPVAHGSSITAYLSSSVPFGETCTSQQRSCQNGVLSGSYTQPSCQVASGSPCSFNGQTIAHQQGVTAYQASTVPHDQTCSSQVRTCTNGSLSGSFSFANCNVGAAASCTFNGQTMANGQSITAYQASSVPFGQACVSEARTCNNGALSGTYGFGSCAVGAAASCTFNGQTVVHDQSIAAYLTSTVPFGQVCETQSRTCINGSLSGSYSFGSCSQGQPASCILQGQTIVHGASEVAYITQSVPFGQTCQSQNRTCSNGTLSGSNPYLSCSVQSASPCTFNNQTIANGSSVVAYAASTVPYGQTCQPESRTCTNGFLSGSYTQSGCTVAAPPTASCSISVNKTTLRTDEVLIVNTTAIHSSTVQTSCDGGGWMDLSMNASNSFGPNLFAPGTKTCSFRGINQYTNQPYSCSLAAITLTFTAPPPPPPPPVQISANGQHCDIGGKWGWRSWDLQCPSGTNPTPPSTVGGCPAGFSQYGDTGCYISNRDSRRPMNGCSNADPNDECCILTCSSSAPKPTYTCTRNQVNDGGGEGGTWIYTNTCTCDDNFQRSYQTNYIITRPAQQQCYSNGEAGEQCYISQPEQGQCAQP